ncbi:MAG: hypothetical protein ACJ8C4_02480 [Gemmataceae bacterium]
MTRRFIVMTDSDSKEIQESITGSIKQSGARWWHRLPQSWLIVDPKDHNVIWWRDRLREAPRETKGRVMVMEVSNPEAWACYLPPDWHKWVREVWSNKET